MNERERRQFESLRELSDQWWRDWDHKSRAEWKLSFGFWVTMLTASAAVGKLEIAVLPLYAVIFTVGSLGLHCFWLAFIQRTLSYNRDEIQRCQKKMSSLVGSIWYGKDREKRWWKQESLIVQLGLTLLLGSILILLSVESSTKVNHKTLISNKYTLEQLN